MSYVVTLDGELDDANTTFSIGIAKVAHVKHQFKMNAVISGECIPVPDLDIELTQYYKLSKLKLTHQALLLISHHPESWFRLSWKFTEKEDTVDWQPGYMKRSEYLHVGLQNAC